VAPPLTRPRLRVDDAHVKRPPRRTSR
jgi:hypothetical protein